MPPPTPLADPPPRHRHHPSQSNHHRAQPRIASQAVLVGDDVVLIGGWDPSQQGAAAFLDDVWALSTRDWAWRRLPASGSPLFGGGVSRHQAVAVGGGRVLIHTHRCDDHVLELDVASGALKKVAVKGPAPAARGLHSLTRVGGDALLLFGGAPQSGAMVRSDGEGGKGMALIALPTPMPSCCLHPPTPSCPFAMRVHKQQPSLPALYLPYHHHHQNQMDDLWRLDLKTYEWRRLAPKGAPPHVRCSHVAADAGAGRLLVVGGAFYGASGGLEMLGDAFVYDGASDEWRPAAPGGSGGALPSPRNAAIGVPLPGGGGGLQLLIHGGWRAFVESYADTHIVSIAE